MRIVRICCFSTDIRQKKEVGPIITAEDLYFSYTGAAPYLLDHLALHIPDGDYVSVVGDNGSGKTTLMRLILGFLKPTSGRIVLTAKRIGYVPQRNDFSNAAFPITVFEALDSYRRLIGLKDRSAIDDSLKQVNMAEHKNALMGTLSGGQAQKILLARAIMGRPELMILDEPSTGVDMNSQEEIYAFIKRLNTQSGLTIVSVEHNLDAAISNSTSIFHMTNGHGHMCTPRQFLEEFLNTSRREHDHA